MQRLANTGRRKRVLVSLLTGGNTIIFFDWILNMNITDTITSQIVPEADRMDFVDRLFGMNFPMRLEPAVFNMAGMLAAEYNGGYWQFYSLSNGGFYMAPSANTIFDVSCDNGFEGKLSADALGIAACIYAYSHLSFREDAFGQTCARHYHWLRQFATEHAEVRSILQATD